MRALGQEYMNTEASTGGDFERLPAGGYVCRIIEATDYPNGNEYSDKPYLNIVYDIAEGEYAQFYSDEWGKENKWAHEVRQYYTQASLGIFKGFLKAVDISNNTNFEEAAGAGLDERKLTGLLVGMIIGEEEYLSNDGNVKTRLKVRGARPVQNIREGKFKQPELKKLPVETPTIPPTPLDVDDIPFA